MPAYDHDDYAGMTARCPADPARRETTCTVGHGFLPRRLPGKGLPAAVPPVGFLTSEATRTRRIVTKADEPGEVTRRTEPHLIMQSRDERKHLRRIRIGLGAVIAVFVTVSSGTDQQHGLCRSRA
jgi:hypothetical protein